LKMSHHLQVEQSQIVIRSYEDGDEDRLVPSLLDGLGEASLVSLGQEWVLPDVAQVQPDEVFLCPLRALLGQVQSLPNVESAIRGQTQGLSIVCGNPEEPDRGVVQVSPKDPDFP
jgi:hypothetical protein